MFEYARVFLFEVTEGNGVPSASLHEESLS